MNLSFRTITYHTVWIAVFLGISSWIGQVTQANMGWYGDLQKSSLTPPPIAFPIVWTTLYILLAICAGSLFKYSRDSHSYKLFSLFGIYMFVNWAWSFIFFGSQMIALGFYWIILSDVILLTFIILSWAKNRLWAYLTLPTFLWGCFAAYLNGYILFMN